MISKSENTKRTDVKSKFTYVAIKKPVTLSIIFFIASLFFTAFFYRAEQDSWSALSCFFFGWLGLLVGYVFWLANPLYFIALGLRRRKPIAALVLGSIAVALAISFLSLDKIIVDEGGGTQPITAYGWGSFLWVLAILTFTLGQSRECYQKGLLSRFYLRLIGGINIFFLICSVGLFVYQYYFDIAGPYQLTTRRSEVFKQLCQSTDETLPAKVAKAEGLFFDNQTILGNQDNWDLLAGGYIAFFEISSSGGENILRFNNNVEKGAVDDVKKSNFSVIESSLKIDEGVELGIDGYRVSITNNQTHETIAQMSYFTAPDNLICAKDKGSNFSSDFIRLDFIKRALRLTPQDPKKN